MTDELKPVMDKWKCFHCNEEQELERGKRPVICPNPICCKKGPFEALSGPLIYFEREGFVPGLMGEAIMRDYHFATMDDTEEIYFFDNKVYRLGGEVAVKSEVQKRLENLVKTNSVNETIEYIRRATFTPRDAFDNPHNLISLENGLLDVVSGDFQEHDPDKLITTYLPWLYDPNADCPKIKEFLEQVMEKKHIPVIQEFIGYCLYKRYQFHRALMLVGDGENGKSTFLSLIRRFLGQDNISSPSLQDLIYNRFATADLYGKLANVHADIPNTVLKITGKFKMLTGGDMVYAEKKHLSAFKFVNHAKLLFSANEIPQTQDKTGAFYRRWMIIPFPNKFTADPNDGSSNRDPYILEKLTTPKEMSGFFNWVLEGLSRLLQQGDFSYDKTPQDVSDLYERMSDPIKAFVDDVLVVDPEKHAPKDQVYQAYRGHMRERGVPIKEKNIFSRMLQSRVPIEDFYPKIDGKRVRCWKGICLRDPTLDNFNVQDGEPQPAHRAEKTSPEKPATRQNGLDLGRVQDVQDKLHIIDISKNIPNSICYVKEPAQPEHDARAEPTTQDIIEAVLSFKDAQVFKVKIAEKAGVSLDRLKSVLEELEKKGAVIDKGAMVEVV